MFLASLMLTQSPTYFVGLQFLVTVRTDGMTMGMFVNRQGNPSRPPLQWVDAPTALAYAFPYVVGLCPSQDLVTVHSVLDQMNKQIITFKVLVFLLLGVPHVVQLLCVIEGWPCST